MKEMGNKVREAVDMTENPLADTERMRDQTLEIRMLKLEQTIQKMEEREKRVLNFRSELDRISDAESELRSLKRNLIHIYGKKNMGDEFVDSC